MKDAVSAAASVEDPRRWRMLAIVGVGELLAMAPWFSSAAVAPLLVAEWELDRLALPALTIAVQFGFAVGALALAVTAAADVLPARLLFGAGAFAAAVANLGFAFVARDPASALPFRVVTGLALAGVYPIGLKLLAGWFRRERGLAIGVLVGALTVGSALPYLLRAVGASQGLDWHATVAAASVVGILGGIIVLPVHRTGRGTCPRRASASMSRGRPIASRRFGWPTWATWATCGSYTRCGRGCRSSSSPASRLRE